MIFAKFSGGGFADSASSLGDREIRSVPLFDERLWGKGNSSSSWRSIAEVSPYMGGLMGEGSLIIRISKVNECTVAKSAHEPDKVFNTSETSGRERGS